MLLSVGLIAIIRVKVHNIIKSTSDADTSCYYRKKFAIIRFVILSVALILQLIIIANIESISGLTIGLMSGWGTICLVLNFPASALRPSQIKDKHFALYLRGFSRDNYAETTEELQKTDKSGTFSEARFIHLLRQYISVYAVGMTKELETPHGAIRVYLNDSEWEKEVESLMNKATLIIILLNDSESCIWEILHAKPYRDKVVYIGDNQDKIINIRQKLYNLRDSCIPISAKVNTAVYYDLAGSTKTISLNHSDKDYCTFIHTVMTDKFGLKRHISSNKESKKVATIMGILLSPVLLFYFILLDVHPFFRDLEHPYILLAVVLILLFFVPYIVREIIYRRRRNNILSKRM